MITSVRIPIIFEIIDLPFRPLLDICLNKRILAVAVIFFAVLPIIATRLLITVVLIMQTVFNVLVDTIRIVRITSDMGRICTDPRS